jgi:hypothetical protein
MPQPGLSRVARLACLALISLLAAAPARAASGPDPARASTREDMIKAHVTDLVITIPAAQFAFEAAGPRLPVEDSIYRLALCYAANFYALRTGDFAVSVSDLLEQGLWPYDTFTAEERNCYLYDLPTVPGAIFSRNNQTFDEYLAECATDNWLVEARSNILDAFYYDHFEYQQNVAGEINADLPEPVAAFWQSAGLLAPDGEPAGEIKDVSITRYLDQHASFDPGSAAWQAREEKYGRLTVPYLAPSLAARAARPGSVPSYDSPYREPNREAKRGQDEPAPPANGVPPAQPAPTGAALPPPATG